MSVFSATVFSDTVYLVDVTPVLSESRGGIDERDYNRYRKYLENLEKAARARDESKYIRKTVEAARELQDIPVDTPEMDKLADSPNTKGTLTLRKINFDALQLELEMISAYLDAVNQTRIKVLEMDDEAAFLILLQ